jgi:GMP synthase-like glutamine amidotransferase
MKVHILQHVPFEDIGSMAGWLTGRRASLSRTRFFADPTLPAVDDLDLVIAMGGPMSVNDEDRYPWLAGEKRFLAAAIDQGVAVVGICLGAQLIASTRGARIYPNPHKEIGWLPIQGRDAGPGCFSFSEAAEVFHWHGETFDLPAAATLLASSSACRNQAFQIGSNVIGLQFHLETTPESLDAIIVHSRDELVPGPYIQSEAAMRAAGPGHFPRVNRLMAAVLDHICPPD